MTFLLLISSRNMDILFFFYTSIERLSFVECLTSRIADRTCVSFCDARAVSTNDRSLVRSCTSSDITVQTPFQKQKMKETIAPIPFRILKCIGLWRPMTWSNWLKSAYTVFTVLVFVLLITITLTVFIGVYQMPTNDDLFAENVFLMFALINSCFKATNVLASRDLFIRMMKMNLDKRWQKLRDDKEQAIQDGFDKTIRFETLNY